MMILLLAALAAGEAPSMSLVTARRLQKKLNYEEALDEVQRGLRRANRRDDLIALYELAGILNATLGRTDLAREVFARLLMVDPKHELPGHLAPRLRRAFDEARANYSAGGWLRASTRGPERVFADEPITIELRLENDPLGMVARFRLSYALPGAAANHVELQAAPVARVGLEIDRSGEGELTYWCTLVNEGGSELAFVQTSDAPAVLRWAPRPADAPPPSAAALARLPVDATVEVPVDGPLWTRWWLWAGSGVALAVAATALTVVLWPDSCSDYADECWKKSLGND